jgi:hypothetical protein
LNRPFGLAVQGGPIVETNEYKLFLNRYVEQVWERGNLAAIGKYMSTDCILNGKGFVPFCVYTLLQRSVVW